MAVIAQPGSTGVSETASQRQQQFVSALAALLGDVRYIQLPGAGETTSSTDKSLYGRAITQVTSGQTQQGYGYTKTYDHASVSGSAPDSATLTFTSGALSIVVLANITDTAAARVMLAKWATNQREYMFQITAADKLSFDLYMESTDKRPFRLSDSAITQGALTLFAGTCADVAGAATAANGITLYQNGIVIASTATNDAAYVTMEDTTSALAIGNDGISDPPLMQGQLGLIAITARSLSASDHWAIKELVNSYYGLSL